MKKIIKSKWKNAVALLLVAVLFFTVSSQYIATGEVYASEEVTSYTVTTNGEADWVLTNSTASKGPITLSYKVESATAEGVSVNGVIATTTPTAVYPYDPNGSMRFHHMTNYLMVEGTTYTITIGVGDDNKVTFSGSYTEANGNTTEFDIRPNNGHLPHPAGPGAANSQYFGLYIAAATTAKLTNVTCVDAEGNDLGLQSNQHSCVITESQEEEEPEDKPSGTSYTVTTNGEGNWALTNGTASKGPITLSYTVESATAASANVNGVIATTTPTAQYPYDPNGSMRFHNTVNYLMVEGRTYTITIGVGSDNKVTFSGSYTEANGTTTELDTRETNGHLPHSAGPGVANCQYFGLYIAEATTAKLTNVTCVDAGGNDLGLQSNQSSCVITKNGEEPSEMVETTVTAQYDWRNCGSNASPYFATTSTDPLGSAINGTKRYTFSEGGISLNGDLQEGAWIAKILDNLYIVQGVSPKAGDILTMDGSVISGNNKVIFEEFSWKCNEDLSYSQYDETAPAIPEQFVELEKVYVDVDDKAYEIAHTPLIHNANVDVYVNSEKVTDYTLNQVGTYKIQTVYETTYFSEVISTVGDITYEQDVILYKAGDANGDGTIKVTDLVSAKKLEAGVSNVIASGRKGADLNMDDTVTKEDVSIMRQILSDDVTVSEVKETYDTEVAFGVISDTHYAQDSSDGQRRLNTRKALNYYKSQNVDMIIFNADIVDLGQVTEYQKLVSDIESVFPNKETRPKLIFTGDNHEYWEAWTHNKEATNTFEGLQERFLTQLTSVNDNSAGMNSHYVINGYHFISISADGMNEYNQASYKDETITFLEDALREAKDADETKPIFVNVHQAPANTVIGTDTPGGCSPYLNDILAQYSKAVVFTSHTHYSIAEENSIWRGAYTVLNTASLYYEEGKWNTMSPIDEADQFAQGLMVRVKNSVVDVERCDFYNNATIGENWFIQ